MILGHDVYTLAVNAALTSAIASLYQGQFSFSIALVQLPLLAVLALGGIPLVYQLIVKLFRGILAPICWQAYPSSLRFYWMNIWPEAWWY